MAAKSQTSKTAQLPAGFKRLEARAWDHEEQPLLVGVIVGFGDAPKKDFGDGQYVPGSRQKLARIREATGAIKIVYESGALGPLFDLAVGESVAIAFLGMRTIEGREKPMKDFAIGVQ